VFEDHNQISIDAAETAAKKIHQHIIDLFSPEKISQLKVHELDVIYESIRGDIPNHLKIYKE
jgi:hypothetical protein